MEKTKILILAANPIDTARLGLGEEYRKIQESLELSHNENLFDIKYAPDLRDEDIQQKLLSFQPHIVHFSGHGEKTGLVFSSANGKSHNVDKNALAALFKLFSQTVRCVILNACYSEDQAEVISEHIRYVIGTTTSIDDEAATKFTTGFYKALFNGQDIPTAFEFGDNAIQLANIPAQYKHKPILKNRASFSSPAPARFSVPETYLAAYETDVFVSYADHDNQTFFGMERGWISTFTQYLSALLQRQLGQSFHLHFSQANYASLSVEKAATLLIFASQHYLHSEKQQQQAKQFLALHEKNRLFLVELMPLQLPDYLQHSPCYKFWVMDEKNEQRTLAIPKPNPNELAYYQRLDDLARCVAGCLKNLKSPPLAIMQANEGQKTVFLAEVTEDLEDRRLQLKRYLEQQGYCVLPEQFYLFNENASALMNADLKRSQWFVQLLSEQSGRGNYPVRQFEQAKAILKPDHLVQWHERDLDTTRITNSDYLALLTSGHCVAMNLIEFQAYLQDKLQTPVAKTNKSGELPYAFVYAAPEDHELAEQVSDLLEQQGIMSALVDLSILHNPAQLCEAIKENLLICDAFILIYGQIQERWIKQNLLNAQGKAARRETPLKVAAIVNKKPPLKSSISLNLLNIPLLQCECDDLSLQTLQPIVQALQA